MDRDLLDVLEDEMVIYRPSTASRRVASARTGEAHSEQYDCRN